MSWETMSTSFAIDQVLGYQTMEKIRLNMNALHSGGEVETAGLADAAVTRPKLSTAQVIDNTVSGSISASSRVDITLPDYCFSPNICTDVEVRLTGNQGLSAISAAMFGFHNTAIVSRDYYVRYRYVTATDKPFIYALINTTTGKVVHAMVANDPPEQYWGYNEMPDDFEPPIVAYDITGKKLHTLPEYEEIVEFNYNTDSLIEITERTNKDKKMTFQTINEKFEFKKDKKLFVKKNLSMI